MLHFSKYIEKCRETREKLANKIRKTVIVKVVYFLTKKFPLQFNETLTKNITLHGFDISIQTLLNHSVGIQFHFWEKSASCRIPDHADKLGIEFENVQLTLLFQEKNVDFFICSRFSLVFSSFSFSKHVANEAVDCCYSNFLSFEFLLTARSSMRAANSKSRKSSDDRKTERLRSFDTHHSAK